MYILIAFCYVSSNNSVRSPSSSSSLLYFAPCFFAFLWESRAASERAIVHPSDRRRRPKLIALSPLKRTNEAGNQCGEVCMFWYVSRNPQYLLCTTQREKGVFSSLVFLSSFSLSLAFECAYVLLKYWMGVFYSPVAVRRDTTAVSEFEWAWFLSFSMVIFVATYIVSSSVNFPRHSSRPCLSLFLIALLCCMSSSSSRLHAHIFSVNSKWPFASVFPFCDSPTIVQSTLSLLFT